MHKHIAHPSKPRLSCTWMRRINVNSALQTTRPTWVNEHNTHTHGIVTILYTFDVCCYQFASPKYPQFQHIGESIKKILVAKRHEAFSCVHLVLFTVHSTRCSMRPSVGQLSLELDFITEHRIETKRIWFEFVPTETWRWNMQSERGFFLRFCLCLFGVVS